MNSGTFVFAIFRTRVNAGVGFVRGMSAPSGYVET